MQTGKDPSAGRITGEDHRTVESDEEQELIPTSVAATGKILEILSRAKSRVGALSRPTRTEVRERLPHEPGDPDEIDWSEPKLDGAWQVEQTRVTQPSVLLVVDTSLSIEGKNREIVAETLAIFLLQFQGDRLGVIGFDRFPRWLKRFEESWSPVDLLRRFLEIPPGGYTHFEAMAREVVSCSQSHAGIRTVFLTDGKRTAGRDPIPILAAVRNQWLIQPGREPGSDLVLREWSDRTGATLRVAEKVEDVPQVALDTARELLRGKS